MKRFKKKSEAASIEAFARCSCPFATCSCNCACRCDCIGSYQSKVASTSIIYNDVSSNESSQISSHLAENLRM